MPIFWNRNSTYFIYFICSNKFDNEKIDQVLSPDNLLFSKGLPNFKQYKKLQEEVLKKQVVT